METLRVATNSDASKLAGMIAHLVKERQDVELLAIGNGAVGQAVKAVAIARGFVATSGYNLSCIPAFKDIKIGDTERTAIKIIMKVE